jgi:hypothetical protein
MQRLAQTQGLVVQQKKNWGEVLVGLEAKNKYSVLDTGGNELYFAAETGGGMLAFALRQFMGSMRPFTLELFDNREQGVLKLVRPFKFYFHQVAISDGSGNVLGTVRRQWSWLRRIYTVHDSQGAQLFTLFGPILKPWTFNVMRQETQIGAIRKKWSGLLKEAFTNADNFGIEWPVDLGESHKALLLGAVFLIDFVHFEARKQ